MKQSSQLPTPNRRRSLARATASLLALVAVAAAAPRAGAQTFPPLPVCGQCPPLTDDPAVLCDGGFGWAFSYDPNDRVPDQPSGIPLRTFIQPVTHDFEIWLFFGSSGLASPTACTPETCLYQRIPKGSFVAKTKKGDTLYEYLDPNAAEGTSRFVSKISIRDKGNTVHVTVKGLVAPPMDAHVSLAMTQVGNDVPVGGGGVVTEPTVSLGLDRRHLPWSPKSSCVDGIAAHDVSGSAPPIFCAPPGATQCDQPPPLVCAKRRCQYAAEIRQSATGGQDTVELHVGVTPASPAIGAQPVTLTLQKTNAPAASVTLAQIAPGQLQGTGKRLHLRQGGVRVNVLQRSDGLAIFDFVVKAAVPPLTAQDDVVLALSVGADTFAIPAVAQPWGTNANGNLVIRGGDGGLPFCPKP